MKSTHLPSKFVSVLKDSIWSVILVVNVQMDFHMINQIVHALKIASRIKFYHPLQESVYADRIYSGLEEFAINVESMKSIHLLNKFVYALKDSI